MVVVVLVVVRVVAGVPGVAGARGRRQVVGGAVGGAGGVAGVLDGSLGCLAGSSCCLSGGREPPASGLGRAVEVLVAVGHLAPGHHGVLAGVPAAAAADAAQVVLPAPRLPGLQCPGPVLLTGSVGRGERLLLTRTVRTSSSPPSPSPGLVFVVRVLPLVQLPQPLGLLHERFLLLLLQDPARHTESAG